MEIQEPGNKDNQENSDVSKEEVASAAAIINLIIKSAKTVKMYVSTNPLLQKFLHELSNGLSEHLKKYGDLLIDVEHFDLKYRGIVIYSNRDPNESLAFRLHSDGISTLAFLCDIQENEISEFLDIVGRDRTAEVDDDIVTLLWIKDLSHVAYVLADDFLEFDSSGGAGSSGPSQQQNIKGLYQSIETASLSTLPVMVSKELLDITEEELDRLNEEIRINEEMNPLDEVVQILSSILSVEKDFNSFSEFIDISINLTSNLIRSEELFYSVKLIRFLGGLSRNPEISPEKREKISSAMNGIITPDLIKELQRIIDTSEKVSADDIKELVILFGKQAIKPMCELLGTLEKMEMRKAMVEALAEVGRGAPEVLLQFLNDKRWYLVRNTVHILQKIGAPSSMEPISRLISHKEPKIRKEVLIYFATISDHRVGGYILRFLNDEVESLRLHALKLLVAWRYTGLLKPLNDIIKSPEFNNKDMAEKKAFYEAWGEAASEGALPVLKTMLMKRYWFNKAREKEEVILAIAGIRKIRSDAALKVLEEAASLKSGEIKTFIMQAIKGMLADKSKGESSSKTAGTTPR